MKQKIFKLCLKARNNAYAPYSNFKVGAACILEGNKAFIGANIENAAYGSTMCAERSCIYSVYSNGYKKNDIRGFGLITDTEKPSMPCGACRQVLNELLDRHTPIYIFNVSGDCIETNMAELLPFAFTEDDLNMNLDHLPNNAPKDYQNTIDLSNISLKRRHELLNSETNVNSHINNSVNYKEEDDNKLGDELLMHFMGDN